MLIIEHAEVAVESSSLWVEDPESGRKIGASVTFVGEDLVIAVGGGEKPHVGCAVLAQPGASKNHPDEWTASCSVLTIPPHKEEPIARSIATRVSEAFGRVTVVTAGVHDDNLDADGIAVYLRLGGELADRLVILLSEGEVSGRQENCRSTEGCPQITQISPMTLSRRKRRSRK